MPAAISKTERENLFREIFKVLRQWSELERRIFSQAHYYKQSAQAISRSFHLDLEEVNAILRQCDRRLHASLRDFRKNSCDESLADLSESTGSAGRDPFSFNTSHLLEARIPA